MIPAEAVEAGRYYPPLVQVVRMGCQDCSYNSKYEPRHHQAYEP